MSGDNARDGKHWELERIVDHEIKRGKIQYLVRWKRYGPKEDKWMKPGQFKYTRRLLDEYYKCLRRVQELAGPAKGKPRCGASRIQKKAGLCKADCH